MSKLSLSNEVDPSATAKRLMQSAHNSDGLPEIGVGLYFLVLTAFLWGQLILPKGSLGFKVIVISTVFLMPVLIYAVFPALKWTRNRYLIDRSGYVKHKRVARRWIGMVIILTLLLAIAAFALVRRVSLPDRWALLATGLFSGALEAWVGRSPRFFVSGAIVFTLAVCVSLSDIPLNIGFLILFGLYGLEKVIAGSGVLVVFLRQRVESGE